MKPLTHYLTPATAKAIGMSDGRLKTVLANPLKLTLGECCKLAEYCGIKPRTVYGG